MGGAREMRPLIIILSRYWYLGQYWNEYWGAVGTAGDIEDTINEILNDIRNIDSTVANELTKMNTRLISLQSSIGDVVAGVGDLESVEQDIKEKLGDVETTLGTIKSYALDSKNYLSNIKGLQEDIKGNLGDLPDMLTAIESSQVHLYNIKSQLGSVKDTITGYLPQLQKLSTLDDISAKIDEVTQAVGTLDFGALEVDLDATGLINEIKKNSQELLKLSGTVQSIDTNIKNIESQLTTLNTMNYNLEKIAYYQKGALDLFSTNLPLAQNYLSLANQFLDLNKLGLKALTFKISPMEYFEEWNKILEMEPTFEPYSVETYPEYKEPPKQMEPGITKPGIVVPGVIPGIVPRDSTTVTPDLKSGLINTEKESGGLVSGGVVSGSMNIINWELIL